MFLLPFLDHSRRQIPRDFRRAFQALAVVATGADAITLGVLGTVAFTVTSAFVGMDQRHGQ